MKGGNSATGTGCQDSSEVCKQSPAFGCVSAEAATSDAAPQDPHVGEVIEFFGLQSTAEELRWMLPVTYDVAGATGTLHGGCALAAAVAALESVTGRPMAAASAQYLARLPVGGCAAVEQAAKNAGHDVTVPFTPGRGDAVAEQTDEESFAVLEPSADGFRNYLGAASAASDEERLIDRAQLLGVTAPEMTVLVGGMRALNANVAGSAHGVLTKETDKLTNDFFVNLLDMGTAWEAVSDDQRIFEGKDRNTGEVKWTATRVDLIFGSNSQLRALAEVYGDDHASEHFVNDFVAAWDKVMNLDR